VTTRTSKANEPDVEFKSADARVRHKLHAAVIVLTWVWAIVTVVVLVVLVWMRLAGWRMDVVSTASMDPAIPSGSLVISAPVDPRKIVVGDVVVFRSRNGAAVMHRVVDIIVQGEVLRFRTQGDLNDDPDPELVHQDSVLRQSRWTLKGFGGTASALALPRGLLWLVGIPLGLLVLSLVLRPPDRDVADRNADESGNEWVTVGI